MTNTQSSTSLSIPGKHKYIPAHDIIECIEVKGMSIQQAADHLECSKQNISNRLKAIGIKPGGIKQFKENRAELLAYYQLQLLQSLTPDEIKKIPPGSRATTFGILYDKERLERGESTQNIAYADMSKDLETIRAKRAALRVELGLDEDDTP